MNPMKFLKLPIQSVYNWYRSGLRHPQYRWWVILGTLAYLVSPLDISPDIFPIIGEIDDVMIVTLLVSELSSLMIDRFKSVQPSPETATSPQATMENETTVDVKAVAMQ